MHLDISKATPGAGHVILEHLDQNEAFDKRYHPEKYVTPRGRVVAFSPQIYYREGDGRSAMWLPEIDIRVGDIVWANYLEVLQGLGIHEPEDDARTCFEDSGKTYVVVRYTSLYYRERGQRMLNGWVSVEPLADEWEQASNVGEVRDVGVPNKAYLSGQEDVGVKKGDVVLYRANSTRYMYPDFVEGDVPGVVLQGRDVMAVLSKELGIKNMR